MKNLIYIAVICLVLCGCASSQEESGIQSDNIENAANEYVATMYPGWSIVGRQMTVMPLSATPVDISIKNDTTGEEKIIFLNCYKETCQARLK